MGQAVVFADESGQAVGHVLYDPLGAVLTNTLPATLTEPLLAGRLDTDLGLQHSVQGWYDPQVAGFLQPGSERGVDRGASSVDNQYSLNQHQVIAGTINLPGALNRRSVWWQQQAVSASITYGAWRLSPYSLMRFSVSASRHKLLTRLPQEAIDILGGRSVIQALPANRTIHTLSTDGVRFVRGRTISRSAFDDFLRVIPGDGRSTRWAGQVGDDFFGHNLSWLGGWRFGLGSAVGGDVLIQWFWPGAGDVWNYNEYGLTPNQFWGRTAVAAGGGALAFGAVALVGVIAFGGPMAAPFLVGAAVFISAEFAYEMTLKPILYEKYNLYGRNERR